MRVATVNLDKRLIKINGREVDISLSAEVIEDTDLELLRQTVDHGDPEANAEHIEKFERGELINVNIKVVAKLESQAGYFVGEDMLRDKHLKPLDFDEPEAHDLKSRLIELLEEQGRVVGAIEALMENIRKALADMGIEEIDIDIAV